MSNKVSFELGMNVTGYKQGMKDAKDSTQQYNTETKKVKDNLQSFRGEMGRAKKEVQNLALAYSQLSKEAKQSQFGREMKKQLDMAKQSAAELIDLQGDLSAELKNLASDTPVLDTLSDSMGIFMNVTSTAMGVLAQLTGNEKDAQKAVVAFTTAQSALNTMTGIANALQSQSTLMLGVRKVQELATTAAIALRTAAEGKGIIVTRAATAAQAAFNAVASANPYVILATAIIGVVGAISAYIAISNDAEEEQEELNRKTQEHIDKLKKQADTYVSAAGESIVMARDIENLREEYKNCNDEISKTAILEEAAEHFKKLGINVNSTSQAEEILLKHGDKVIDLIKKQGEMAAVTALKIEILKNTIKGLMQIGFDSDQATNLAKFNPQLQQLEKTENRIRKENVKLNKELGIQSKIFGNQKKSSGSGKQTSEVGIKIEKGSLAEAEKKLNELEEKRTKINIDSPDLPKIKKEIEDLKKDIAAKKIVLGIEVETKSSQLSKIEKEMQDELNEAGAALTISLFNNDNDNIEELILNYDRLKQKMEDYNKLKEMTLKGVESNGSQDYADAKSGNFDKSINGYNRAISALQERMKNLDFGDGVEGAKEQLDDLAQLIIQYSEKLKELQEQQNEALMTNTEKEENAILKKSKAYRRLGSAMSDVGDIFDSLSSMAEDDPVLNIAGIVAKAIANVAAAYAQALGSDRTTNGNIWAFIAAAAASTISMIATIASIHSATGYAQGGIVGGSSYSGDHVAARLNSGEMVLNKHQQQNLFNAINSGNLSSSNSNVVQVEGVINGNDILLVSKQANKIRSRKGTEIHF